MEQNSDLDNNKTVFNYFTFLIGLLLIVIGYIILCLNELNYFINYYFTIAFMSIIFIHSSPIFLSNLYSKIKKRDISGIGNVMKNFIILELILIIITFDIIIFL
ncbi:MAG: hypothetical protein ACTSPY_14655 [Candidatus Helarchaeota archaeon]